MTTGARRMTAQQHFINRMRRALGLQPLYGAAERAGLPAGASSYVRAEKLMRAADRDCKACDGYGYVVGDMGHMKNCACTGMQRKPWTRRNHAA